MTDRTSEMARCIRYVAASLALAVMPLSAVGQGSGVAAAGNSQKTDTRLRHWGISATIGSLTQQEAGGRVDSRENDGNAFGIAADYYLSNHFALTAGVYAEQTGLLTELDYDGIGKKKYWMAGLHAGAKYYPLPKKWIVQPYIGASLYANVLNLGHSRGSYDIKANDCQQSRVHAEYDVHCPALSLAPQVGVDLRLLSSLSLTLAADCRFGLYGRSRTDLRYLSGPDMGTTMHLENPMSRTVLSLGFKIDFPLRPVNWDNVGTTLFDLLYMWINGRN